MTVPGVKTLVSEYPNCWPGCRELLSLEPVIGSSQVAQNWSISDLPVQDHMPCHIQHHLMEHHTDALTTLAEQFSSYNPKVSYNGERSHLCYLVRYTWYYMVRMIEAQGETIKI